MVRPLKSDAPQRDSAVGAVESQRDARASRRPWFAMGIAVLASAAMLIVGTLAMRTADRSLFETSPRYLEFHRQTSVITHLDEVLTMSALMYAATGDSSWRVRYEENLEPLDAAILRVRATSPALFDSAMGDETDEANQALVAMETSAINLTALGRGSEAMQILRGEEYLRQKDIYAEGNARAIKVLGESIERTAEKEARQLEALQLATYVLGAVVLSAWILVIRVLRRDGARSKALALAACAADQAKSEFLANMSHEIRTPLTAIIGFAEVLQQEIHEPSSREAWPAHVESICRAGRHLLSIINDILDLSKIEARQMEVEQTQVNLEALLLEIESLLRPRALSKQLQYSTTIEAAIPSFIVSDPTRLRQILFNLVGNAIKFTATGSVSIRIRPVDRPDGGRIQFDVVDTGPGMSAAQKARLFTAFSQADSSITRAYGGTGLGLTICRRLAELLGGTVELVRSELNEGSCFRIEIPLVPAAGTGSLSTLAVVQSKSAESRSAPGETISLPVRVLLVEDGEDNRRLISHFLRKAGATVDLAENGQEALERIEICRRTGQTYQLVLSDMQMPVLDGYGLAVALRRQGDRTPLIALTAHAMESDRQKCIAAGCNDYVTKPVDRLTLLRACRRWSIQTESENSSAASAA